MQLWLLNLLRIAPLRQGGYLMNLDLTKMVLVVEDQEEISDNMSAMLIRKGYRVQNAIDADGAMTLAEKARPAMILTDLDLPTLDTMMVRLRAHKTLKNLLVAIVDIDHAQNLRADVTILNNFDELDQLLASFPAN
jgi:DNA-binding NtrC family response regulator